MGEKGRPLARPKWVVDVHECPGCAQIAIATEDIEKDRRSSTRPRLRATTVADFVDP